MSPTHLLSNFLNKLSDRAADLKGRLDHVSDEVRERMDLWMGRSSDGRSDEASDALYYHGKRLQSLRSGTSS